MAARDRLRRRYQAVTLMPLLPAVSPEVAPVTALVEALPPLFSA